MKNEQLDSAIIPTARRSNVCPGLDGVPGRLRGKITVNATADVIGFVPLKHFRKQNV